MLTREKALALLRDNQDYLRREFGVRRIGVFGSVARHQCGEMSDVDLIVEFSRPIGFRFMDLADHLENLLGRRVDLLTPAGVKAIRLERVGRSITEGVVYV